MSDTYLIDLFHQWLLDNNKQQATEADLHSFLDLYVLNDPETVEIADATVTVLWSYTIDGEPEQRLTAPWMLTQELAENLALEALGTTKIRVIGETDAGKFLDYLQTEGGEFLTFSDLTPFWSDVSRFFVAETDHSLITITPYAGGSTIFGTTEIDALVANEQITEVNGVSRADLGIDIFPSGHDAQRAYLLAILNGEFSSDLLRTGLARITATTDASGTSYYLDLDAYAKEALGLAGVSLVVPSGTEQVSADQLRLALLNSHTRGLHAALLGPVMSTDEQGFLDFFGHDFTEGYSESPDLRALQDAVAGFVEQIWQADPTADVSSLIAIAMQASAEGDHINPLVAYFKLLTEKVQPYIEDAPEELKRDLSQSITEILDAARGLIDDVPADLQKRLAVTSGGRELYLLDQWRQELLHPGDPEAATLNGVGIYSQSETDLGTALYLTFGASSAYAIVRNSVEQLIDTAAVPLREKIDAIVEHFDYFEGAERKIVAFLERVADYLGDTLGAPFQNSVFGQFQYADGKAAVQALDSSSALGNDLQLQIGADEATLIGNDNANIAMHFGHGNVYGLGGNDKLLGLNSDLGEDGKALELHGGYGDDVVALAFGEGGFAHGDDGDDLLIGGGKEAHLTGGSGNDTFVIGSGTHIEDGETGDSTYFAFIQLFGGVAPWWSETNTAVWAPFTSLSYAFPVIGAELLAVGAIFADAATMNFARYRMTPEGDLQVEIGYGLGGNALIHDYSLDLSTGQGTAGITVFKQGGRGKSAGVDTGVAQYVNLALYAGFGSGLPGYDPLVLDLDGDGFEVTAREYSQVYFDFESTGFAKQTGWVGGDDALLTRDVNGNGIIDDGSELFGNRSQSGFAELGSLDSNSDGLINSSDAEFGSLRIWRDLNQDGVSQANELMTLADAGIASISLAAVESPEGTEVRNNVVARTAQFTRTDGTTGAVGDITFDVSDINTRWTGNGDASAAAEALPQLGGLGLVRDLRLVMTDDSQLLTMVNNLVGSTASPLTELFG